VIWVKREEENFFEQGWTAQISLMRFNKSGFSRIVERRPQSQKEPITGFSYLTARSITVSRFHFRIYCHRLTVGGSVVRLAQRTKPLAPF